MGWYIGALEGVREGSVEERRPQMDRETCCENETKPTNFWYKRTATVIGCGVKKWISHFCNMKTNKSIYIFLFFKY